MTHLCDYCEHSRYDLVSFVLKVSVNFRSVDRIIKLALDALKELVRTNSCKYSFMVATHLKCTFAGQTRSRVPMDCMLSTST